MCVCAHVHNHMCEEGWAYAATSGSFGHGSLLLTLFETWPLLLSTVFTKLASFQASRDSHLNFPSCLWTTGITEAHCYCTQFYIGLAYWNSGPYYWVASTYPLTHFPSFNINILDKSGESVSDGLGLLMLEKVHVSHKSLTSRRKEKKLHTTKVQADSASCNWRHGVHLSSFREMTDNI